MEHQRHAALNSIKSILIEHKAVNRVDLTREKLRLDTKKVIYVVYNTKDKLRYIGQSVKDAIGRFMQHLQAARRMEKSESVGYKKMMKQQLLYVHMVK